MLCPKCGRTVNDDAFICPGCDFILDTSFLGSDFTDDEQDLRPRAIPEAPKARHSLSSSVPSSVPTSVSRKSTQPAQPTTPKTGVSSTTSSKSSKTSITATSPHARALDLDAPLSGKFPAAARKQVPAPVLPPTNNIDDDGFGDADSFDEPTRIGAVPDFIDFGENAMILGAGPDDFDEPTGMLTHEITQVRFYIGASIQALLEKDSVPEVPRDVNLQKLLLDPFEQHIVGLVNGKRTVARITKKSGLSDNEVKTALATLADKGAVRLAGKAKKKNKAASIPSAPAITPAASSVSVSTPASVSDSKPASKPASTPEPETTRIESLDDIAARSQKKNQYSNKNTIAPRGEIRAEKSGKLEKSEKSEKLPKRSVLLDSQLGSKIDEEPFALLRKSDVSSIGAPVGDERHESSEIANYDERTVIYTPASAPTPAPAPAPTPAPKHAPKPAPISLPDAEPEILDEIDALELAEEMPAPTMPLPSSLTKPPPVPEATRIVAVQEIEPQTALAFDVSLSSLFGEPEASTANPAVIPSPTALQTKDNSNAVLPKLIARVEESGAFYRSIPLVENAIDAFAASVPEAIPLSFDTPTPSIPLAIPTRPLDQPKHSPLDLLDAPTSDAIPLPAGGIIESLPDFAMEALPEPEPMAIPLPSVAVPLPGLMDHTAVPLPSGVNTNNTNHQNHTNNNRHTSSVAASSFSAPNMRPIPLANAVPPRQTQQQNQQQTQQQTHSSPYIEPVVQFLHDDTPATPTATPTAASTTSTIAPALSAKPSKPTPPPLPKRGEAEKIAEKPVEKPAEKHVEKLADKPVEKVTEKVIEKVAEKSVEKPAQKPAEKTIDKKSVAAAAAAFGAAATNVPYEARRKAEKIFEQAQKDFDTGNLASALMNARLALVYFPQNPMYIDAMRNWEQAKSRKPVVPPPTAAQVQAEQKEKFSRIDGKFDKNEKPLDAMADKADAKAEKADAKTKSPEEIAAERKRKLPRELQLYEEALAAEGHGEYERAVELLKQAIIVSPKSGPIYNRLGVILSTRLSRYGEAANMLMSAIELEPQNLVYKNNLGKVYAMEQSFIERNPKKKKAKADENDAPVLVKKIRPRMF